MSKGSTQRPTNKKKFDDNWDRIFKEKKSDTTLSRHYCQTERSSGNGKESDEVEEEPKRSRHRMSL